MEYGEVMLCLTAFAARVQAANEDAPGVLPS